MQCPNLGRICTPTHTQIHRQTGMCAHRHTGTHTRTRARTGTHAARYSSCPTTVFIYFNVSSHLHLFHSFFFFFEKFPKFYKRSERNRFIKLLIMSTVLECDFGISMQCRPTLRLLPPARLRLPEVHRLASRGRGNCEHPT